VQLSVLDYIWNGNCPSYKNGVPQFYTNNFIKNMGIFVIHHRSTFDIKKIQETEKSTNDIICTKLFNFSVLLNYILMINLVIGCKSVFLRRRNLDNIDARYITMTDQ